MNNTDYEKLLFDKEISMLEDARKYLNAGNHSPVEMQDRFSRMADAYAGLLKNMQKIVKISDSQAREIKRRESELHLLLNNASQGFLSFRRNLLIGKEYSAECVRIFGHKIANLNVCELLAGGNQDLENIFRTGFEALFDLAGQAPHDEGPILPEEIKLRDRLIRLEAKHVSSIGDWEDDDLIMVMLTDITEEKHAQEQILYLSYHDRLTGLYNRAYLDQILPQVQTSDNLPFSIIIGDMNGLKLTNDVFGHKFGDQLLTNMANVLRICSRENDVLVRWGGDEFLILLPKTDADQANIICERIHNVCREHKWDPIELSAALGSATQTTPGLDFSELFGQAESRMYANKSINSDQVLWRFLSGFEKNLALRCDESQEHSATIVDLATRLWEASRPKDGNLELLRMAARFHDIGKVSIDEHMFDRKCPLTEPEWEIMKRHSEAGYRTAKALNLNQLATILLSIHERWDGMGYPQQLYGEQIPLESRIIAIAETYDVLTRGKKYKNQINSEAALEVIRQGSGSQFDPLLVEQFTGIIHAELT